VLTVSVVTISLQSDNHWCIFPNPEEHGFYADGKALKKCIYCHFSLKGYFMADIR